MLALGFDNELIEALWRATRDGYGRRHRRGKAVERAGRTFAEQVYTGRLDIWRQTPTPFRSARTFSARLMRGALRNVARPGRRTPRSPPRPRSRRHPDPSAAQARTAASTRKKPRSSTPWLRRKARRVRSWRCCVRSASSNAQLVEERYVVATSRCLFADVARTKLRGSQGEPLAKPRRTRRARRTARDRALRRGPA